MDCCFNFVIWLRHVSWFQMFGSVAFFPLFLLLTLLQVSPTLSPVARLHLAPTPRSLWPLPHCCLCLWVMHVCYLANPFTFFHPVPAPKPLTRQLWLLSVFLCIHTSVSTLFIRLLCSLDSTYKWDHLVFVFLWFENNSFTMFWH